MNLLDSIFNQFIEQSGQLSALPDIYQKLDQLLKSGQASIADIGFLISSDAALTAQVLKLANSPAFGFKAEITTIDRAISLIGTQELKNLVLVEVIVKNFNTQPCSVIQPEDFWLRSAYQAIIAKKIALHFHHPKPDRLFVCGILSQIGELMCCFVDSSKMEQVSKHLLTAKTDNNNSDLLSLYGSEKQVFGFTYNQLSARLLNYWKIPQSITQPVSFFSESLRQACLEGGDAADSEHYKTESFILYCASLYSFLLEVHDSDVLDAAFLLEQVAQPIQQHLKLDEDFINELLIDIEIDAMELLSAIFPNSLAVY